MSALWLCLAGCGASGVSQPGGADVECAHRIGLVVGAGSVNDGGGNQAAWQGVAAGREALGLREDCASFVEAASEAEYLPAIEALAADGFDIIVTTPFTMQAATHEAGRLHPEVSLIGVDQRQTAPGGEPEALLNVVGLVYREEREGFLAGALAGLLTKSGAVGGVFGCETLPPVIRYAVGFRNGAQHVNPGVVVESAFHIGSLDICFFDPDYGAQLARGLVEGGADVLFGAGGQTGDGALVAACQAGASVIGSSTDRYAALPAARDCLASSVTRDTPDQLRDLIVAAATGALAGGEVYGQARLAPYHDFEGAISPATKQTLDELAGQLGRGEIDACAPPNEGAFCAPVR